MAIDAKKIREETGFDVEGALKAGYSPREIEKYISSKDERSSAQKAGELALRALNFTSDMVGGSIKAGKEVTEGTYQAPDLGVSIPLTKVGGQKDLPLGETLLPTLVGAYRGARDQTPVMDELPKAIDINPSSPAGLAIGLAGEIATPDPLDVIKFGDIAGKTSKKLGLDTTAFGKRIARRGVKASPSQLTKFTQKTGKELDDVLVDKKLTGNVIENTIEAIRKSTDEFDEIAVNSGVRLDAMRLVSKIDDEILGLGGAYDEAGELVIKGTNARQNKAVIKGLNELRQGIVEDVARRGASDVDIGELTKLRRAIDDGITDNKWRKMLEGTMGADTAKRNILQEFMREQTEELGLTSRSGRSLKEIGKELSELIEVDKILAKQKNLGKGSNVVTLTSLLSGGFAGVATEGDIKTKIKNGLVTAGFVKLANNPRVIGALSNVMVNGGEKLVKSSKFPKIVELILRAGKEGVLINTRPPTQPDNM